MITVGSRALALHVEAQGKEFYRPVQDLDYLCTEEEWEEQQALFEGKPGLVLIERIEDKGHIELLQGVHLEYDIAQPGSSTEKLIMYCLGKGVGGWVAPLEVLYLLKMSHRYKKNSPHFFKTMSDIHYMRSFGAEIPPELEGVLAQREKETYDYSHPNLNVNSVDFFKGDEVPYIFDHDSIHEAIAVLGEPAYKSYMRDGSEVMTDKEKFFACEEHIRLLGVYEESCVLALERSQIPFGFEIAPRQSFIMALSKVCTSITSGWFREYAWEHFDAVVNFYNAMGEDDYIKRFKKNDFMLRDFKGGYE